MSMRGLLREVWRNVESGTTRAVLGALVLAAILMSVGALDGLAKRDVFLAQRAYRSAGAHISTIDGRGKVDATSCMALGEVPAVQGAIALRERGTIQLDVIPNNPVAVYEVAGDPTALLGGDGTPEGGVALSSSLAERLGVVPGSVISTAMGNTNVAQVVAFASDGRNPALELAMLVPVPATGQFDQCWTAVWPPDPFVDGLLLSTVADNEAELGRLNTSHGEPRNTQTMLDTRPTWFLPFLGTGAAVMLGFALVRARRVELALALQLGVSRRAQLVQVLLETGVWLVTGFAVATTALLPVLHSLTVDERLWMVRTGITDSAGIACAAVAGTLIGLASITGQKLIRWAKDR